MENIFRTYWLDEVDSTNEEAQRRILAGSEGSANLSVVAALRQTAGRGQGLHKWHSRPGDNLTFTVVLRYGGAADASPDGAVASVSGYGGAADFPPFPASRQKEISDITAQAVVDYLSQHGVKAWIKEPNDVWVGGRKICGLLIKHRVSGAYLLHTIIGIGLNINEKDFPADLPNPTSLILETAPDGCGYDISLELERFLSLFSAAVIKLFAPSTRR